jgi:hypothetical protein
MLPAGSRRRARRLGDCPRILNASGGNARSRDGLEGHRPHALAGQYDFLNVIESLTRRPARRTAGGVGRCDHDAQAIPPELIEPKSDA